METIIAIFFGAVASFLQGEKMSKMKKWVRLTVAIGSCLLISSLIVMKGILDGDIITVENVLGYIGSAFLGSQIFYQTYFKKILNGKNF